MLPEFEKLQRENNKLKVILKDKDAIVQTTKNDLIKLHKKATELGLQVNIANQKLEHEDNINTSLGEDKRKLELMLKESTVEVQKLKEELSKAEEEAKKKLEESELEKEKLKEKISQFESGSSVN